MMKKNQKRSTTISYEELCREITVDKARYFWESVVRRLVAQGKSYVQVRILSYGWFHYCYDLTYPDQTSNNYIYNVELYEAIDDDAEYYKFLEKFAGKTIYVSANKWEKYKVYEEIVKDCEKGYTSKEIGAKHGYSADNIRAIKRRHCTNR